MSDKQRRGFSPTRRGAAEQEAASSLSPVRSGRGQPAGGVTGVVGQAHDAGAGAGVVHGGSSGNSGGGAKSGSNTATPGSAAPVAAEAVSEKGPDAVEANRVDADTLQQPAVTSSSSAASPAASFSVATNPVGTTGVVDRGTTVSGRKRAAAAAKAKAREQEAAAVAAAAEAKQLEASSSLPQMSRAEKKSRQAMEKLGLRTVKGVFRMTMRTTTGVVFVVKAPDVFKHPQQVRMCLSSGLREKYLLVIIWVAGRKIEAVPVWTRALSCGSLQHLDAEDAV